MATWGARSGRERVKPHGRDIFRASCRYQESGSAVLSFFLITGGANANVVSSQVSFMRGWYVVIVQDFGSSFDSCTTLRMRKHFWSTQKVVDPFSSRAKQFSGEAHIPRGRREWGRRSGRNFGIHDRRHKSKCFGVDIDVDLRMVRGDGGGLGLPRSHFEYFEN